MSNNFIKKFVALLSFFLFRVLPFRAAIFDTFPGMNKSKVCATNNLEPYFVAESI